MDLDFTRICFDLQEYTPHELEECFEDPFGLRFLPEDPVWSRGETRYFLLARTLSGRALSLVFWSDGKVTRVISVRGMTESEARYYERKFVESTK